MKTFKTKYAEAKLNNIINPMEQKIEAELNWNNKSNKVTKIDN